MRYYCCFLIRQFEEINWIYWRDNVLMVIYMFPSVQFLVLIYDYQFDFRGRFSQLLSTLTKILCYGTLSCWCETIRMWQFWWFFHTAKINQREGVACQNFMRHSLWIMRILASGKLFIGLNSRRFELYITTKPIWLYCQVQNSFISREI